MYSYVLSIFAIPTFSLVQSYFQSKLNLELSSCEIPISEMLANNSLSSDIFKYYNLLGGKTE